MDKETQARWTRLQALFSDELWEDLKAEIDFCLKNADRNLKSQECSNREFMAGKCAGIEEILNLKYKCAIKE